MAMKTEVHVVDYELGPYAPQASSNWKRQKTRFSLRACTMDYGQPTCGLSACATHF